jgi:hypothetical protein
MLAEPFEVVGGGIRHCVGGRRPAFGELSSFGLCLLPFEYDLAVGVSEIISDSNTRVRVAPLDAREPDAVPVFRASIAEREPRFERGLMPLAARELEPRVPSVELGIACAASDDPLPVTCRYLFITFLRTKIFADKYGPLQRDNQAKSDSWMF